MMSGGWKCSSLMIVVSFFPGMAMASGLRNVDDGWLLQTREIVKILNSNSLPPSYTGQSHIENGLWATVGTMQLFSMPELPVQTVSVGLRFGRKKSSFLLAGYWQRTGRELFQDDVQTLFFGWEKQGWAGFQIDYRRRKLGLVSEPSWSGLLIRCGFPPVKSGPWLIQSEIRIPVWATSDWVDHERRQRRLKLGISRRNIALGGALDKKSDTGWALGLELSFGLASGAGITLRCDPDTGSIGPGTIWLWGRMLLKTSHVVHPELGITHRISFTTGTLGAVPW